MCRDSVYRDLHSQGIGTAVQHTPTFSSEDEEKLWETGCLVIPLPRVYSVLCFLRWKDVCIRDGEEQRNLGPSQFLRSEMPDCYMYVEHGSKTEVAG